MARTVIKLGYAPTRRDVFSKEEAIKYKKLIKDRIVNWGVEVTDLEGINEEGLLFNDGDLEAIIDRFKKAKIDALFFPHCNFGSEALVAKVAKAMDVPVLIWGPRDEAPLENGLRTRDTQCGLFATGKVLRRFKVPFTYLTNSWLDSDDFKEGFQKFLAVSNVIKAMKNLRILQISTRPTAFWSVMVNENELLEKFGVQTYPVPLQEVTGKMDGIIENKPQEFIDTFNYIKENISKKSSDDKIAKMAALKTAIKQTAQEYGCTAAAIQCWNALQDITGIMPCLANALLADEGLPCACETDIHGAITAVMLQAAAMDEKPHFFADITVRHPEKDNVELLWHCGPFPFSLAKDPSKANAGDHWILESGAYGTCEWEIKGGDMTIARFDGDGEGYKLFIGEGKGVDGPFTRGTYLWLEVNNWPKWESKLVKGPYIHHVAGIHGKLGEILYEACRYIPGLMPDPVEPTLDELEARWLGK
jgi:L-fucose isomerase-like protein